MLSLFGSVPKDIFRFAFAWCVFFFFLLSFVLSIVKSIECRVVIERFYAWLAVK